MELLIVNFWYRKPQFSALHYLLNAFSQHFKSPWL